MAKRVPQPPIDPASRPTEARDFWTGAVVVLAAIFLIAAGSVNETGLRTLKGDPATELQLVRAFAYGGLRHLDDTPPPPPTPTGNPALDTAAMDRWERQLSAPVSAASRIRVDTGAQAACPT